MALLADFIANERPIYCQVDGESYFPIGHSYLEQANLAKPQKVFLYKNWRDIEYEKVIFPIIPYSPSTLSPSESYLPPFSEKHYLGTAELGKDVAAGMIHGTRLALLVGMLAMFLASLIGIFLGSLAGYFGDYDFKTSRARLWLNIIALPFVYFYAIGTRSYILQEAGKEGRMGKEFFISFGIGILVVILFNLLAPVLKKITWFRQKNAFPFDFLIMRLIEVINSIPVLLLLLAAIAVIQQSSLWNVILILGFLGWTSIARFVRSELLRIRSLEYINAAKSMGFSEYRTLLKHALPNGLTPVLIIIAFGIAASILFEASLSFLGIGVAPDEITWGKLLAFGRGKPSAWWLAIFPGLAIFVSVMIFNLIGEGLSDALNPKKRRE